jgi:hypothetical protein
MGLPLHDVYILAAVEDSATKNATPQLDGTTQVRLWVKVRLQAMSASRPLLLQ